MKQLVGDLPFAVLLQKSEYVGRPAVRACEFPRPVPNLQMDERDGLDDFDSREARLQVRRGPVRGDPFEDVLDGSAVFRTLAVARYGCFWVKRGPHQFSVARASSRDIKVHGASNRIVFDQIPVAGKLDPTHGVIMRLRAVHAGESGTPARPGFNLMLVSEDRVVLLVLPAMDGKALIRLPTPDSSLAAVQETSYLLPGL